MTTSGTLKQERSPNGSGLTRRAEIKDTPGSAARISARNRSRILVGCLVTVASAFTVAVLYSDAGERQSVLAVAQPVAAGQIIEADDLREVRVATDGSVSTVAATASADVVGRTASVALVPGALLTEDQFGDAPLFDPSEAVFGAVLAEGRYPVELRAGDRVLLYELPGSNDTAKPIEAVRATVVAVRDGQTPGSISATLSVAAGDAGAMATAAGQDRLILVLAPR